MKKQTSRVPLKGFVVLKYKMYTFITEGNHEYKKAEAINKNIVDDKLKQDSYKNVLFDNYKIKNYKNYKKQRL